jgi:5'-3' exonuclease
MMDGDKSDNIDGIKGVGLKTIIKSFPILKDEQLHTIDSLEEYVKALPKKTKAHNLFLENLEICKRNCKLMQLAEPDFSGLMRMKIMDRFEEQVPHFDKQLFLKYALSNHIMDSFSNINEWLNSTFSHINKFR